MRTKDREDLEEWFKWLCDPAFVPTRRRRRELAHLRKAVQSLEKAKAKAEEENPGTSNQAIELALADAREALRVSDFHTYETKIRPGNDAPMLFSVSSMSGGEANYGEAERLFVAVCISSVLWPEVNPYVRVQQEIIGKEKYADQVAHGYQPEKQVRGRVKRFTHEAVVMRWSAIGFSWPQFKTWKNWDRIYPQHLLALSGDEEAGRKAARRWIWTNKREVRFITELLKVQLAGWGPPPPLQSDGSDGTAIQTGGRVAGDAGVTVPPFNHGPSCGHTLAAAAVETKATTKRLNGKHQKPTLAVRRRAGD